jgi:hypothetical protein
VTRENHSERRQNVTSPAPRRVEMPKAGKSKYYAVKIGREGPRIYTDWEQVRCDRWTEYQVLTFGVASSAEITRVSNDS